MIRSNSSVYLLLSPLSYLLFLWLLLVFPFFPSVVSISSSPPVPGDGYLTPGIRSQWTYGGSTNAALEVLWLASRWALLPWCSLPKGIPTRDNGQLTRVNTILLHASLQQRHRQRKGKNKCKYSTILPGSRKPSHNIQSQVRRILLSALDV